VVQAGVKLVVDVPALDTPVTVDRDMWEKIVLNLVSNAFKFTHEEEIAMRLRRAGDARRLEQVVSNLLVNVSRYAPARPVDVQLEDRGDTVRLTVRDFGPGVPPEQREAIFDRFDRGGASRNAGGLGLGLYIARQVVLAHGGTLVVTAEDGPDASGARFVVELPRDAR
jgi:signal transduction histidine kinase